jgi:hypothetical protein
MFGALHICYVVRRSYNLLPECTTFHLPSSFLFLLLLQNYFYYFKVRISFQIKDIKYLYLIMFTPFHFLTYFHRSLKICLNFSLINL